jgi:hypothetical protein
MLVSWLPGIGDPLCTLAGWLRMPFWPSVGYMAIGKFLRYLAMTGSLLWIPDSFWHGVGRLPAGSERECAGRAENGEIPDETKGYRGFQGCCGAANMGVEVQSRFNDEIAHRPRAQQEAVPP